MTTPAANRAAARHSDVVHPSANDALLPFPMTCAQIVTSTAKPSGDPRARWTDQADQEILAEFPTTVRMLPKWATIRDAYRTTTAIGHLIDGLIAGIPG